MNSEFVLQVLLAMVVLMLLGGITQALPVGLGSVKKLRQSGQAASFDKGAQLISDQPITTDQFDRVAPNQVITLTTERAFAWIVAKPLDYYRPGRYLLREALTQLAVAIGLVTVLRLTAPLDAASQLLLVGLMAVLTGVATYGQLLNWWGLTRRYAIGAAGVIAASWTLTASLVQLIW